MTTQIDRYELKQGLGRGSMGAVYLAVDTKIGREVAIKVLDVAGAHNPKAVERFEREARAIAALRHPNIVDIFDVGVSADGHYYFVMELLEGPDLMKLVRAQPEPIPQSVAAAIGMELAAALARAHQAGILHRDIKPENIFVSKGRVVLADFGVVKVFAQSNVLGDDAKVTTELIGTPGYMAPEQVHQQPLGPATDVFQLGAVLYWLLTNQLPFEGSSLYELAKNMENRAPSVATVRPEVTPALAGLIAQCIEIDPELRPHSAEEVRGALRSVLDRLGAGDARETLMAFQKNPSSYVLVEREQRIERLVDGIKIAVRDRDAPRLYAMRDELRALDPKHEALRQTTGVHPLLRLGQAGAAGASPVWRTRMAWWFAGFIAAVSSGAVAWLITTKPHKSAPPLVSEPAAVASSVSRLRVEADQLASIYLNGRALGRTARALESDVEPGDLRLEAVHAKHGTLTRTIPVMARSRVQVRVSFAAKRIDVMQTPLPAP